MIIDIPAREDFEAVGTALLNQSWEIATSLLLELDEAKQWADEQDIEQYWKSSSTKMATALSIAHQGAEFLIKGRIVEISPYLLIANAPRDWPKVNSAGEVSFSKFRTIDAQDLIKLHDNAAAQQLSDEFAIAFEALRIRRNSIMHTVDRQLKRSGSMRALFGSLYRFLKSCPQKTQNCTSASISSAEHIVVLAAHGITNGASINATQPCSNLTRQSQIRHFASFATPTIR